MEGNKEKVSEAAYRFIEDLNKRRSIHDLGDKIPFTQDEVIRLVLDAIREYPSSYNGQSARLVFLFGEEHKNMWNMVLSAMLRANLPPERLAHSQHKIQNWCLHGAGTILFYEDQDTVKKQQEANPRYTKKFPVFSEHGNAIAQYAVWCTFATANIGASLHHYNELIEEESQAAFEVPASWKLVAQMPFGSIEKPREPKPVLPDEVRYMVRGAMGSDKTNA